MRSLFRRLLRFFLDEDLDEVLEAIKAGPGRAPSPFWGSLFIFGSGITMISFIVGGAVVLALPDGVVRDWVNRLVGVGTLTLGAATFVSLYIEMWISGSRFAPVAIAVVILGWVAAVWVIWSGI